MSSGDQLEVHERHEMVSNPWSQNSSLTEQEEAEYANYAFVAAISRLLLLVEEVVLQQIKIQEYVFSIEKTKEMSCWILAV